jgi:CubicO group peptidase (beta-lactamase class C family)
MTRLIAVLLASTNLLACVDDPAAELESLEPDQADSDDVPDDASAMFNPCFFTYYQLSQIASQAATTLDNNGATGWSVVAMRRVSGQTTPCVATSSGGFARSNADGFKPMTADTQVPIASQSKIVTSVAATKILAEAGIPRDTSIAAYLPSNWFQGPGVANITFADLMRHRTGLFNVSNGGLAGGWGADVVDDLQSWLLIGAIENPDAFDYANAHMTLLQLLAARIKYGTVVYSLGDAMVMFAGQLLEAYVRNELLFPFDIGTTAPVPSCSYDASAALRYANNASSSATGSGLSPTTDLERCGMGRWSFTPRNFAKFLDRLDHGDLLGRVTTEYFDNQYGFDMSSDPDLYSEKGGNIPGGPQQFKNRSYVFEDGTIVVAQINSNSPIGTAVPDAYDAVMP